ncbi:uncharacterized protein LY79DRAFT_396562 [Colletotrichum navitas]|uniref:Uncharacterized protein n=1 Tax=Colletotrichum navitas TaxID=681940 RepID=A0AAD8PP91_9PEZI|nr:uncharacterized protein LY79DRAFT_396562 [Colletotrichum navitas]KAK1573864.1 hypothetical protein LY79DRAFT_396562 [Colletotrichum navitas]
MSTVLSLHILRELLVAAASTGRQARRVRERCLAGSLTWLFCIYTAAASSPRHLEPSLAVCVVQRRATWERGKVLRI